MNMGLNSPEIGSQDTPAHTRDSHPVTSFSPGGIVVAWQGRPKHNPAQDTAGIGDAQHRHTAIRRPPRVETELDALRRRLADDSSRTLRLPDPWDNRAGLKSRNAESAVSTTESCKR
jgi:hypothetical protein